MMAHVAVQVVPYNTVLVRLSISCFFAVPCSAISRVQFSPPVVSSLHAFYILTLEPLWIIGIPSWSVCNCSLKIRSCHSFIPPVRLYLGRLALGSRRHLAASPL
ncbi:hypothetical protein BDW75DRAFT_76141 [Aspergillus navahoensis]